MKQSGVVRVCVRVVDLVWGRNAPWFVSVTRDRDGGALLPGGGSAHQEWRISGSRHIDLSPDAANKGFVLTGCYQEGFLLVFLQVFIETFVYKMFYSSISALLLSL